MKHTRITLAKNPTLRKAMLIPLPSPTIQRVDLLHAIKQTFFADCPEKFTVQMRRIHAK